MKIEARVWTALVGIPIVLAIVVAGGLAFKAFCLALALLAFGELARAFAQTENTRLVAWIGYPATLLTFWLGLRIEEVFGLFAALGVLAVVLGGSDKQRLSLASLCATLFATLYVSLFALLPVLRGLASGGWFWLVLLLVWTGDTLAYYGGKAFGKHPLSPLSPKKTREGALIGFVAALGVAPLGAHFLHLPLGRAAALGITVGLAAPLGDLFESFLKRELGVKDLGTLLPGHGGVLDRCDSLLFATLAALAVLAAR